MGTKGLRFLRGNAIGLLALFIALGGTGYAASGGFTAASTSIKACAASNGALKLQTGKKCKRGQKPVAWNQQGVAGAKGATGVSGIAGLNGAAVPNATNAASAGTATTATTAQTANNALALGGIPAAGFTQRSCASDTGQVKGWAQIPGNISETFIPLGTQYNCSGGAVEARQGGTGKYQFRFVGNPAEVALATPITSGDESQYSAHVARPNATEWIVVVSLNGVFRNEGVSIVLF